MHSRVATLRLWNKRLNAGLGAMVALAALLYAVFLLLAVTEAAARAHAGERAEVLSAHLASLEERYLALEREITPARAEELGLVKPRAAATVFADTQGPTLTLGNLHR